MASAAFCSFVCQGPRQNYWIGFPIAALLCLSDPCPAPRFPRFWATPRASRGKEPLVHCREYSNGAILRDKDRGGDRREIGRSNHSVRDVLPALPMERGPAAKLGSGTFNELLLLELRIRVLLHTCLADNKPACESEFLLAGRCFFYGGTRQHNSSTSLMRATYSAVSLISTFMMEEVQRANARSESINEFPTNQRQVACSSRNDLPKLSQSERPLFSAVRYQYFISREQGNLIEDLGLL
jgi:hypothetical protein